MKRRTMIADRATAEGKTRLWAKRAINAHEQGRTIDAGRCEDKARDWASRVRAIDRNKA